MNAEHGRVQVVCKANMRKAHSGAQQKTPKGILFGADAGVGALKKVASGKFLANNERRIAKAPMRKFAIC